MSRMSMLAALVALLVSAAGLSADTIPGGDVSGTWVAANSPYYINGNITVQAGDTLSIEPGVEVRFLSRYSMVVSGLLEATGTEAESISFCADTYWWGLSIGGASDTSRLEYCTIEAVDGLFGAVYCERSSPMISHCRVSGNPVSTAASGITLQSSDARISRCVINGNHGHRGGGIRCLGTSAPHISHCRITGNRAEAGAHGGGVAAEEQSCPVLDSCVIVDNAALRGGGIAILDAASCILVGCAVVDGRASGTPWPPLGGGIFMRSPTGHLSCTGGTIRACLSAGYGGGVFIESADSVLFERAIIEGNNTSDWGGAVHSAVCRKLLVDHCDVVKNTSDFYANGIMLDSATGLTLTNSIFSGQGDCDLYFDTDSPTLVSYGDFYDSAGVPFQGNPPAGLGTLVQTNANGDSCDIFYNILLDPLFVDFPNGDYDLTAESPCIDAGDPAAPRDPDSTYTDMGALFFFQTGQAERGLGQATAHLPGRSIVREVLILKGGRTKRCGGAKLLDAAGRRVVDLHPGENDVSRLAPGVYYVRTDGPTVVAVKLVKIGRE